MTAAKIPPVSVGRQCRPFTQVGLSADVYKDDGSGQMRTTRGRGSKWHFADVLYG